MVHFGEYSGRVEEIYLPEDGPMDLETIVSIADAGWAEQEARRADSQPGLVLWTDGSRDENGAVGYACSDRGSGFYPRDKFTRRGVGGSADNAAGSGIGVQTNGHGLERSAEDAARARRRFGRQRSIL